MTDPDKAARLAALEAKIDAAKGAQTPKPPADEHYSGAQHAWRMVIELVSGLGIGFGIGYGLDSLFGTMPLFLVLFILLGFIAGIKTMMRSANEIQEKQLAEAAAHDDTAQSGDDEGA